MKAGAGNFAYAPFPPMPYNQAEADLTPYQGAFWPALNGMPFAVINFRISPCGSHAPHMHAQVPEHLITIQVDEH